MNYNYKSCIIWVVWFLFSSLKKNVKTVNHMAFNVMAFKLLYKQLAVEIVESEMLSVVPFLSLTVFRTCLFPGWVNCVTKCLTLSYKGS